MYLGLLDRLQRHGCLSESEERKASMSEQLNAPLGAPPYQRGCLNHRSILQIVVQIAGLCRVINLIMGSFIHGRGKLDGCSFCSRNAFRNAIKEAAIAQHFELRIIKSDLIRYFAKCASEGCPWRIRAVKLSNAPTFTIRSLEGTHTCGRNAHDGHHQASIDWIVSFIDERLRSDINYKPKDILHDIYKQYGIKISYKQAWRAKERGLAAIYGSSEDGYCLLPAYCEQIKRTNPGSVAKVFTTGADNRFHGLFVSFYGSICGFLNGCLPIVGLGGIQLKSKYLGTLLSATSFDADGGLFPLAFGIADVENDESWM
ncbi:uncharacterized protein LOC115666844 [Syzygium oleosum]|uniref:uncharacterized protein LOC115666844 n=1 Tax=Syzygium oleosum TaxID=219896 RepID=UPI0024B9F9DC|nr:uncharacterized protein LOC115666844 [Syzygium oleosum]